VAKFSILAGSTSQSINIFIASSSSTTGGGLTGLVYNTSGLTAYYSFTGTNAGSTSITLATLAAVNSAYSSGGFKEIDSTNMPGTYRLDLPNAVLAASKGQTVTIYLQGAANLAPLVIEIELTAWNNQDGVRGGMTAFPNVASGTTGCLVVSGSGTGGLTLAGGIGSANVTQALGNAVTTTTNGILDINVKNYNNVTATTDANNYPKVDIVDIAGTAVSVTTAQLGINVVNWNNTVVATPATAGIPDINVKNIVNTAAAVDANNYLKIDVVDVAGTAVSATAGLLNANVTQFGGTAITQTAGIPSVNTSQFNGTAATATAGIPSVNTSQFGGTAITQTAGIPSVNTSQFLGHAVVLDTNNFPKVDVQDILGATSAGTAGYVGIDWSQIADYTASVNLSGTTISNVTAAVSSNVTQFGGTAITQVAGIPSVNTIQFNGTTSAGTAGYVGIDWGHVAAPTTAVGLTNTTISSGQTISTVTGSVNSVATTVTANTTQFGGTAITQVAGIPSINLLNINGHTVTSTAGFSFDAQTTEQNTVAQYINSTLSSIYTAASAAATLSGEAYTAAGVAVTNTTNLPTMIQSPGGNPQYTAYALAEAPGGSSSGSGNYAITFTVKDSISLALLSGVTVSAILANTETAYATTNSSGVAVLNLNAGTYEFLARSNSGAYYTFASTGNVVTGIEAVTIPLVAYPAIIPATPPQCVISFYLLTSAGLPRKNVRVSFSCTAPSASPLGNSYTSTDYIFSSSTGLISYTGLCGTGYAIEVQGGSSINITTPTNIGAYIVPNPPG
jgi:hypothetical protein